MKMFTRTAKAAEKDRTSKWDLIAAIAEDAEENEVPIVGLESRAATLAACEAVGVEYASNTVKNLCMVAKFDHDSTPEQREIWRRYGWTVVREPALAGWTPEATAEVLGGERLTQRDVAALVGSNREVTALPSFDERVSAWVVRFQSVMTEGAELVMEAERDVVVPGGHAALMLAIFAKYRENQMDYELQTMLSEAS